MIQVITVSEGECGGGGSFNSCGTRLRYPFGGPQDVLSLRVSVGWLASVHTTALVERERAFGGVERVKTCGQERERKKERVWEREKKRTCGGVRKVKACDGEGVR